MEGQTEAAAQPPQHDGVACPGVPGPDPTVRRATPTHSEIGCSRDHELEQWQQVGWIHRAVTVHHSDVLGRGGFQPGVHGGPVSGSGLVDHCGTEIVRHLSGPVSRAVVDHQCAKTERQIGEQRGQCRSLVTTRNHDVADGSVVGHVLNVVAAVTAAGPKVLNKD